MSDSSRGVCLRNRILFSSVCSATLMWAGIPAAQAEDFSLITQTGQISLGMLHQRFRDEDPRGRREAKQGTIVDWGKTVGDNGDVTRFRLDGLWRINPRHHIRMMYTDYSQR